MSTLPATIHEYADQLQALDNQLKEEAPDKHLLKLRQEGYWSYGVDDIETQEGSQWAINPQSISLGYIAWLNSQPVGEHMAPFHEPPINPQLLENVGAPWSRQYGFQLQCMTGDDVGQQVFYKTNSDGGRKAFTTLVGAVRQRLSEKNAACVPLVKLEFGSYVNKKKGNLVYNPIFNVVDWLEADDLLIEHEGAASSVPEPEPEPVPDVPKAQSPTTRKPRKRPTATQDTPEPSPDPSQPPGPHRRTRRRAA